MKNLLHTTFLVFALATFASGQTRYMLAPNPTSGFAHDSVPDAEVHSEIHNLTADTLKLHWVRNVISITQGCETAVCDAITCYNRPIGFRDFKLMPNITKPFLVHFYNNGAHCEGIVHIKITNNNDPTDSVTVVYLFNQSTDVKDLPAAEVKLFPNPVTSFFALENAENVATIRVFTLEGREVATFEANAENKYIMPYQPAGVYVMALEDKNGRAFQALELVKH